MTFNNTRFSKELASKIKKDNLSFRTASPVIGISSATLCRLANGSMPDLISYGLCCRWLEKDMEYFMKNGSK